MRAVSEARCSLNELEQLQLQKNHMRLELVTQDARRRKSLGNCVTESAAAHLTSSSSVFVHCNETCGHLCSLMSATYRVYMLRE